MNKFIVTAIILMTLASKGCYSGPTKVVEVKHIPLEDGWRRMERTTLEIEYYRIPQED